MVPPGLFLGGPAGDRVVLRRRLHLRPCALPDHEVQGGERTFQPGSSRPMVPPCPDLVRVSTRERRGLCSFSWMPTELVRGLKAHGPSPAKTIMRSTST
jgi:hypothetical protein